MRKTVQQYQFLTGSILAPKASFTVVTLNVVKMENNAAMPFVCRNDPLLKAPV